MRTVSFFDFYSRDWTRKVDRRANREIRKDTSSNQHPGAYNVNPFSKTVFYVEINIGDPWKAATVEDAYVRSILTKCSKDRVRLFILIREYRKV